MDKTNKPLKLNSFYGKLIFRARDISHTNLPKTDCHIHTSWTDGKNTINEMFYQAEKIGLLSILFSEHSRKTSAFWFPFFAKIIRSLDPKKCSAFVGTEVKVTSNSGEIDTNNNITKHCDLVIASVHRFVDNEKNVIPLKQLNLKDALQIEYCMALNALDNPNINILGHVFGMCSKRFHICLPAEKLKKIICKAKKLCVAIEINSKYHMEPHKILEIAQECDAFVTLGSDAHSCGEIGKIHISDVYNG